MRFLPLFLLLAPQEETTLRVAWGTIRTVDPALAFAPQDVRVVEALFDGLGGAEAKADGPVVTFKLPDRKWSDGKPVTASNYRFAWLRCLDPSLGCPWAFRFRHIKGARAWHDAQQLSARLLLYENGSAKERADTVEAVGRSGTRRHGAALDAAAAGEKEESIRSKIGEAVVAASKREDLSADSVGVAAVDARTLRVTLETPHPGFPTLAATTPFRPVPEHVIKERRDQWTHPLHLVTSGAFMVEKWTRQGLVLGREGTGPGVKRISFVTADLTGEVWPLYERDHVDWLDRTLVPPEKIEALIAAGEIRAAPGAGVAFLRLNSTMKPGLRKAMAMAVDRAALLKKAGPGSEETKSLSGGAEGPARDLAAAVTSLAGEYPDLKSPKLRLLLWREAAGEELARAVRDQLEEALAVSIRLDPRESAPYHAALASGDFDLALGSFTPEAGDPLGILDTFPEGRTLGEKALIESALAIPLIREGEWFAAKPRVQATPGTPLSKVTLKK